MAALSVNSWIVIILTLSGYLAFSSTEASDIGTIKTDSTKDSRNMLDTNFNSLSSLSNGNAFSNKRSMRSIYGFGPKMLQISRSKIPIELDLLVENNDGDRSKRFDDYGHMRFGKRGGEEQFDDYGHMRFGRSV